MTAAERTKEVVQHTSFLCNVYLFSGFFFPASDDIDIKYKYKYSAVSKSSAPNREWTKDGAGPYHTVDYFDSVTLTEGGNILDELYNDSNEDTHTVISNSTHGVLAFASAGKEVSASDQIAWIEREWSALIYIKAMSDLAGNKFKAKSSLGGLALSSAQSVFNSYTFEIYANSFEMEQETSTPSTSGTEFLVDIIEYVGLFTGICTYSLLVAPARMYLRRGATASLPPSSILQPFR
jgi:hypothetical protein